MKRLCKDKYLPSQLGVFNKKAAKYTLQFTLYYIYRELGSWGTRGTFSSMANDTL